MLDLDLLKTVYLANNPIIVKGGMGERNTQSVYSRKLSSLEKKADGFS